MYSQLLKNLLQTTGPTDQTWHKASLGEGNSHLSKGPHPFPWGDNSDVMKMHWQLSKIFFRTTEPPLTKLGIKHIWLK